jgi:hypothetical protein
MQAMLIYPLISQNIRLSELAPGKRSNENRLLVVEASTGRSLRLSG